MIGVVGEQTFGAGDGDQALIGTNELEGRLVSYVSFEQHSGLLLTFICIAQVSHLDYVSDPLPDQPQFL